MVDPNACFFDSLNLAIPPREPLGARGINRLVRCLKVVGGEGNERSSYEVVLALALRSGSF